MASLIQLNGWKGEEMANKYFQLITNSENRTADLYIYGDIVTEEWFDGEVSANDVAGTLAGLDVDSINVYINSYGGVVSEGIAIYNALKRHKAKVTTYCDGFACSIASVIFMAGDERVMANSSLLFVHNAWTNASGNAEDLRKQADALDTITECSINAYLDKINISREELVELLDGETWLNPTQCYEMGFATTIVNEKTNKASQSVKRQLYDLIEQSQAVNPEPIEPEPEPGPEPKEEKNVMLEFLKNL